MAVHTVNNSYSDSWTVDSACSNHMTANKAIFVSLKPIYNVSITIADGKKVQAEGMGDVQIKLNGKRTSIYRVYYVPGLGTGINLISTAQLADRGIKIVIGKDGIQLYQWNSLIGTAKRHDN